MRQEEFRREMNRYRQAVHDEADQFKYPYLALERLCVLYRSLDPEERTLADEVIADWVLSDDPNIRFDALALIREFHIGSAIPSLEELAKRLPSVRTPGAPYELEKVNGIISSLTERPQSFR
jgi:hypothetical protein